MVHPSTWRKMYPSLEPRREAVPGDADLGSVLLEFRGEKMAHSGEERTGTGGERKENQWRIQQKARRNATMHYRTGGKNHWTVNRVKSCPKGPAEWGCVRGDDWTHQNLIGVWGQNPRNEQKENKS